MYNIQFSGYIINDRLSLFTISRSHRKEAKMKRNAYNDIYSGNTSNVCICLTTAYKADGSV